MRSRALRLSVLLLGGLLAACASDQVTTPSNLDARRGDAAVPASLVGPAVVISQVYGGGGNSGATLTHDFVELFNRGTTTVDLTGWSVQYASSAGTTWSATVLSGSIAPGGYYLVQQAQGAGGTISLPTPDAVGTIAMAATAGKVVLSNQRDPVVGACPAGESVVDRVGFGTTSTSCASEWNGRTATLSNTTAALRTGAGCVWSDNASVDFEVGAPMPRNSASATNACTSAPPAEIARIEVAPASATVSVGATVALTASAFAEDDAPIVGAVLTWSSDSPDVASVSSAGLVAGVGVGTALISATAPNGIVGTAQITVEAAAPPSLGAVVISQVYGGGGNSGATLRNDFIELFNAGSEPVNLSGWSVQYASSSGSTWQVTPLGGTIAPGGYYLVQQAAGSGGSVDLPAPDAIGSINMSGTNGKVLLANTTQAQSTACPTGAEVRDRMGFGSSNCGTTPTWGNTPVLSNTTAAYRDRDGCVNTGDAAADFVVLAPAPRNSASPVTVCGGGSGPDRPQSPVTLLINELMGDPVSAESASWGEWFEVYNFGDAPVDLQGYAIMSGGTSQPAHLINRSVVVPARGYAVLGRGGDILRNGGVTLDYNYFVGSATTIWLDDRDYLMLVDGEGARIDSVSWTSLPRGVTKALSPGSPRTVNVDAAPWKFSNSTFGDGDYGTPGALNSLLAPEPPFVSPNRISISGRTSGDAPLPVGFEAQLFATLTAGSGPSIPTTFTWTALTPTTGSVDERGVIRALAAGLARFRVTAADGTTRVHSLLFEAPVASTTAEYRNHLEFGLPGDGDTSDDFLVVRPEFVSSFNGRMGIPNWVAYNLNGTHIAAGQDRCNCFTFDPELEAAGFTRYNTADYTGSGAFAGYGIDRGHLVRSFDRTTGSLDNARTYYFSNIVPQAADMNQGPWAQFENFLGDKARLENKEVYIYAGVAGSIGTLKNEGKVTIPEYNWKVAVVLPRGAGLQDVRRYDDLDVIAVVMPNRPGIRNDPWPTFSVTVDSVERLSGYDLLAALRDDIEVAVESGTAPPVAVVSDPFETTEWTTVTLSSSGSLDPDGDVLTFRWSLGDGTTTTGATVHHRYTGPGDFSVRLIAIDPLGLADTVFTTATVRALQPLDGIERLEEEIRTMLADGRMRAQDAGGLNATLQAAALQIARGQITAARAQLSAFQRQVTALERTRRLASSDASTLRALARSVLAALMR
jgi:DNA/RNA endonuclease G (NUC1)